MDRASEAKRIWLRRMSRRRLLGVSAGAAAGLTGLALVGCGDDDEEKPAVAAGELRAVDFALDWVPNTNHTGFYVADAKGWYAEEGVKANILPYGSTSAATLVSAGAANFGISFGTEMSYLGAQDLPIASVMAILQKESSAIVVKADRTDINSPKDLDGKLYAGFGAPYEQPFISTMIKNDGGRGEFDVVTLDTAAYEALYAERVDFAWSFLTWEGIEAELQGQPMRSFAFQDYGFPDWYGVVLIGNTEWMSANRDLARAFVRASRRGFEYATEEPEAAAAILIERNADVFTEPDLPTQSAKLLAEQFYLNADGEFGPQTLEGWTGLPRLLYQLGLLTDADGNALKEEIDYSRLFTNDYLT